MTLSELTQHLRDNIQSGSAGDFLVLDTALLPAAGELVAFLGLSQLRLDGVRLTPQATQVRLTGTADFLGTAQQITLTGSVSAAGAVQLVLQGLPPAGWKLADSFPDLPQYLGTDGTFLETRDSFFYDLDLQDPTFFVSSFDDPRQGLLRGLQFAATLRVTDALGALATVVGGQLLPLAGSITLRPDEPPLLDWVADIATLGFDLGEVMLSNVHLLLRTEVVTTEASEEELRSTLAMAGTVPIASIPVRISTPLLQGDHVWPFTSTLPPDGLTLASGLSALTALVSGSTADFPLPEPLESFTTFALTEVVVGLDPRALSTPSRGLDFISLTVASPEVWNPPLPRLAIRDVSASWFFLAPLDAAQRSINATVRGTFLFGESDPVALTVATEVPDFTIIAELEDGSVIRVTDALEYYFGFAADLPTLDITELRLRAEPRQRQFYLRGEVETGWSIDLVVTTLTLETIALDVQYGNRVFTGEILGVVAIGDPGSQVQFLLSAAHPAPGAGWTFSGALFPDQSINLTALAQRFLSFIPPSAPDLPITGLALTFNTLDKSYSFQGRTAGFWELDLSPEVQLRLAASVFIERRTNGDLAGSIEADFVLLGLSLQVGYDFAPDNRTLRFLVRFKGLFLAATLIERTVGSVRSKVLEVQLGGFSFGEMLEALVNLAVPGALFELDSPWDLLNEIRLDDFVFTIDLTTKAIGFKYTANKNFGFVNIETLGLTYLEKNGRASVNVEITGRFLDKVYGSAQPLTWDALNDAPPAVPGKGSGLLDLRYLGLGQHVTLRDTAGLNDVAAVITALKGAMLPPTDPKQNPLTQLDKLRFDADSGWLVGLDLTVLDTVTLSVVFNDPYLYGLLLALSGKRAGSLSGLRFQLLYKKVTDDIGVYMIELKVPDAFRQLDFGSVSITLPIILLDIFTNGDFRVDLGFPKGGNFANSFVLQVFPFIGKGGLYLAKLSGDTATSVPQIVNGEFSPVIEFGLGLAVGLGKEFNKGPLRAGLSITVQAVVEGVIAWFNPYDPAVPDDRYYRIQGMAAIVGQLYGAVDFRIIRVDVAIVARASVQLVIQAHEPILIALEVSVSVRASIKIVFVRIRFSFSLTIRQSFSIGSRTTPPWIVGQRDSGSLAAFAGASLLEARRPATFSPPRGPRGPRRSSVERLHFFGATRVSGLRAGFAAEAATSGLDWTPVEVFASVQTVPLTLMPTFSVALPSTLLPETPPEGPPSESPAVQAALLLFVENAQDPAAEEPTALRAATSAHSAVAGNVCEVPFNVLLRGLLGWSIHALLGRLTGNVTSADLATLEDELAGAATADTGFTYANLKSFLEKNFRFRIAGPPQGETAPLDSSGTVFPMIPELAYATSDRPLRRLRTFRPVDETYEQRLAEYFAALQVAPAGEEPATPAALEAAAPESLATVIFRDSLLMLARSAVQEARDLLEDFPYTVAAGDSLASIAGSFPAVEGAYRLRARDTIESVAALTGSPASSLEKINASLRGGAPRPGETLTVAIGVSVDELAEANQGQPLRSGTRLAFDGVRYRTQNGDTLAGIAARFAGLGFDGVDATALATSNALDGSVLAAGATLALPEIPYTTVAGDSLRFVAASFLARNRGTAPGDDARLAWYRLALQDLNPTRDLTAPPPGTPIQVPRAYLDSTALPQPYTSRAGDTLDRLAASFLLAQADPAPADLTAFEQALTARNPGADFSVPGTAVTVPAQSHPVIAGETLAAVGARLGLTAAQLGSANADTQGLLVPLAELALPPLQRTAGEGDSLESLAADLDFTLPELAQQLAGVADLFPEGAALTVPDLPQLEIARLLEALCESGRANNAAGMISRYLLHGLRLPAPDRPDSELYGLYDLTGQQFPAPAVPPPPPPPEEGESEPEPFQYEIEVTNDGGVPWVQFADTLTVQAGDTFEKLVETYPDLAALNPGIDPEEPLAVGLVLTTALSPRLDVRLGADFLRENYPATTFDPVLTGPSALPQAEAVPLRYALPQSLPWQAAEAPPLPNSGSASGYGAPAAGQPSLWLFSTPLLGRLAEMGGGEQTPPFELVAAQQRAGRQTASAVGRYAWASAVRVKVRRVEGDAGALPTTYAVLGAGQRGRQRLLSLRQYLEGAAGETGTRLLVLYQLGTDSSSPRSLASEALDPAGTFLLQTNLSTLTTSGVPLAALESLTAGPVGAGEHFAGIAAPEAFLRLLWQASITGTGGYHLSYRTTGGGGLPADAFDDGGEATLWVVTLLGSAIAANPDRTLKPFYNCAAVGDNLDAANVTLFGQAAGGSELTHTAALPPGQVGFELQRKNPELSSGGVDTPQERTLALYSLLGYRLLDPDGSSPFTASHEGLPAGPQNPEDAAADDWIYRQVLPVARFAKANSLPQVDGLPPRDGNPYAGIAQGAQATVGFAFHDVLGNRTQPPPALRPLPLPVGYTDDVIGLGQWPGAASNYQVVAGGVAGALLEAVVTFQPGSYLPGPGLGSGAAADSARTAAARYGQVYTQLRQPDVDFALRTSLGAIVPSSQPALKPELAAFVSSAYLFLESAAEVRPLLRAAAAGDSLAKVAAAFPPLSDAALLEANRQVEAAALFATSLAIPRYHVAAAGETLAAIAADAGLSPETLVGQNLGAALTPGVALTTGPRSATVPAGTPQGAPTPSLAALATAQRATVAGIAAANAAATDLLTPGVSLTAEGAQGAVAVTVGEGESLDALVARLAGLNVETSAADLATANENLAGLLVAGAPLTLSDHVLAAGETFQSLAALGPAYAPATLAGLNLQLPGLFAAGASLLLGTSPHTPPAGDTVLDVAEVFGVTVAQLAVSNAATALTTGFELVVPERFTLPEAARNGSPIRLPYRVAAGQSLTAAAAQVGQTAQDLATANRQLPDLLAAGRSVAAGGATVSTQAGDSLAALLDRLRQAGASLNFAQLVAAIAGQADLLRTGALLVVPPPTTGSGGSLDALATRFQLPVAALALANAGLAGWLRAGASVQLGADSLTVLASDTLSSLVARFAAEHGVETTVDALAAANAAVDLLAGGRSFLLPPAPALLTGAVQTAFPATIFRLTAELEMKRDPALRSPDFTEVDSVWHDLAVLPPRTVPGAGTGGAASEELTAFARTFEAALPGLKVATGQTDRLVGSPQDSRQLWAVNLGPSGIHGFAIAGTRPSFFALRPLANRLIARSEVPIFQSYDADGQLTEAAELNFQAIDLEVWARDFLAAVELFLSADYAVPAFNASAAAFEQVAAAKKRLAAGIAAGADFVLTGVLEDPTALASAREALRQRLLIDLAKAYGTDAIVHYPTAVTSPYTGAGTAPRFSGKPINLRPAAGGQSGEPESPFTLSSAKTPLVEGGDSLTFLVQVKTEAEQRSLTLDLTYAVNEMEYEIADVPGVEGFQSSSWLSFVIPLAGDDNPAGIDTRMGPVEIPLPLRSYPTPPQLLTQSGTATVDSPQTLGEAKLWTYGFTYEHREAAQDTVFLEVIFNEPDEDFAALARRPRDLFDTLAQFITLEPSLSRDLAGLLQPAPPPQVVAAVKAFAQVVANVADTWQAHWAGGGAVLERALGDDQRQVFNYRARLDARPGTQPPLRGQLTLELQEGSGGRPGPVGDFPDVAWVDDAGTAHPLAKKAEGQLCVYRFLEDLPAFERLQTRLSYPGLDVVVLQNAWGGVHVSRNENLVATHPTREAFIYRTPQVFFANKMTPLLERRELVAIRQGDESLEASLARSFEQLLAAASTPRSLQAAVRYGYELVQPVGGAPEEAEAILSLLPIRYRTKFVYDPSFPAQLAKAVESWPELGRVSRQGGLFVFEVSVFSSLSGNLSRPLLELERLFYRLENEE